MYRMSPATFAGLSPQQRVRASVHGLGAVRGNIDVGYAEGGRAGLVQDRNGLQELIRTTLAAPTINTVISGGRYVVTPSGNELETQPNWRTGYTRLPGSQIRPGHRGVTQLAGLGILPTGKMDVTVGSTSVTGKGSGITALVGRRDVATAKMNVSTNRMPTAAELAAALEALIKDIEAEYKNYDIDPLPRTWDGIYTQLETATKQLPLVKADFDKMWPKCADVESRGITAGNDYDTCQLAKGLRPRISKLEGQIMALRALIARHPENNLWTPQQEAKIAAARALAERKAAEARAAAEQLAREEAEKKAKAEAEEAERKRLAAQGSGGSGGGSSSDSGGSSDSSTNTDASKDPVTMDYSTKTTSNSSLPSWALPVGVGVLALGLVWWARK